MKKNMIVVKSLNKSFAKNVTILNNVSFNVSQGSFHACIGVNGAGKTTIIKSLLGAIKFEGEIFLNGHSTKLPISKKSIGYVPAKINFPQKISVIKYLTYMGYIGGLSMREARNKSLFLLSKYGVSQYANKSPNSLSSGEHKKIMLIQALINDPKILIMDEPTSHLDSIITIDFFRKIQQLVEKDNLTVFLSTHKLFEVESFCDSLTIIDKGKIIFTGKKDQWVNSSTIFEKFANVLENSNRTLRMEK